MKKLITFAVLFVSGVLNFGTSFAQLSGPKSIPGDYATIAAAIAALNPVGVGAGGVTFNVAAGYTETGVNLTINIAANQPTAANPVVFQKSGAGANPLVSSLVTGSGTIAGTGQGLWGDAFFKIVGTDFITFDGIDVKDNYAAVSTTLSVEYGYLLLRASSTDGCKNVTIKNCSISLFYQYYYGSGIGIINYNG